MNILLVLLHRAFLWVQDDALEVLRKARDITDIEWTSKQGKASQVVKIFPCDYQDVDEKQIPEGYSLGLLTQQ